MDSPYPFVEMFIRDIKSNAEVSRISHLTADEITTLAAGTDQLPSPLVDLIHLLLHTWSQLDPATRTAAMLVLANALAL